MPGIHLAGYLQISAVNAKNHKLETVNYSTINKNAKSTEHIPHWPGTYEH